MKAKKVLLWTRDGPLELTPFGMLKEDPERVRAKKVFKEEHIGEICAIASHLVAYIDRAKQDKLPPEESRKGMLELLDWLEPRIEKLEKEKEKWKLAEKKRD